MLALALLLALQDKAEVFFDAIRFADASTSSATGDRVLSLLRDKRHWLAAYRAIETRLGPMKHVSLDVSFDYEGEETAKAAARGGVGKIRFNLNRLESHQDKVDELEQQKKDLAREGKKLVFRVAPTRIDRVIWHEMTHIFHADYEAPEWFLEGLAQWLSEDPNTIQAFAHAGRDVHGIEAEVDEKNDVYARGHLFWSWVAARGAVKRVVQASVVDRGAWKASVEGALGLSWSTIEATEREWSAREIQKVRDRQK